METIRKKNFCVKKTNYTVVYAKRTYIEWYEVIGNTRIRKKIYAGINRIKDAELQYRYAIDYISKLHNAVSTLIEAINADRYNLRPKTIKAYTAKIYVWLDYLKLYKINELDVSHSDMILFIDKLRSKGLTGKTVKSYYTTIVSIYNRIGLKPFEKIKIQTNSTSLSHYNVEQKTAIIDYCKKNNYSLYIAIKLLYHCYIRPGEIRLLQFKHLDFEKGIIKIPGEISKNKKTQTVVIPEHYLLELHQFCKLNNELYVIGSNEIGAVKPVKHDYLNKSHRLVLNELKIIGNYALYSWKHTGVVDAVRAGIGMKDIQLQLRHHSLDMVNEYLKNLGVLDCPDLKNKMPPL